MTSSGRCMMPGKPCERLATLDVDLGRGLGRRLLCHTCHQALFGMGLDMRRPIRLPVPASAA